MFLHIAIPTLKLYDHVQKGKLQIANMLRLRCTLSHTQGNDTPSSIRIRENQRRSRNQRKELIQDLQRRVQDYEAKGIAATQEMQRAARKVAEENARLKSLLASRGVSHEEVDAYLRSFDAASAPSPSAAALYAQPAMRPQVSLTPAQSPVGYATYPVPQAVARSPARITEPAPAQTTFQHRPHPPTQHHAQSFTDTHRVRHSVVGAIQDTASEPERANDTAETPSTASYEPNAMVHREKSSCCKPLEAQRPVDSRMTESSVTDQSVALSRSTAEDDDCPNTTSCFCPPTSAPQGKSLDNGLLISCETAATIISEMRGDGDRHRIRASLGCQGDQECSVKNTLVLELMDER